jgi:hypothetical protein
MRQQGGICLLRVEIPRRGFRRGQAPLLAFVPTPVVDEFVRATPTSDAVLSSVRMPWRLALTGEDISLVRSSASAVLPRRGSK